jgi:hypothetical protein
MKGFVKFWVLIFAVAFVISGCTQPTNQGQIESSQQEKASLLFTLLQRAKLYRANI